MKVLRTRKSLIKYRESLKGVIGFVPTMGALHEGHLSLVHRARRECDRVIASIFVNPTQFGPDEDYLKYPRPEKADLDALRRAKCDAVFIPKSVKEVYFQEGETSILARPALTSILCGLFRPGHFDGVCTVVYKLFSWARPDRAYFGLKDYQQVQVIQAMIDDFGLNIRLVPCPIQREKSGLALSSRNYYFDPKNRAAAAILYKTLSEVRTIASAKKALSRAGFKIQYLENRSEDLSRLLKGRKGRWIFAGFFKGVRLIDNVLKK